MSQAKSKISSALNSNVEALITPRRRLSNNVVTREYRAPEVILTLKAYDQAVDIWSLGCILAELIRKVENGSSKRGVSCLFNGSSCYPISPCAEPQTDHQMVSSNDQLIKILEILGKPSQEDLSFIGDENIMNYQNNIIEQSGVKTASIRNLFPNTSSGLLDLLECMLSYNPYLRPTAKECLQFPIFDSIHNPDQDNESSTQVKLEVDSQPHLEFDYE